MAGQLKSPSILFCYFSCARCLRVKHNVPGNVHGPGLCVLIRVSRLSSGCQVPQHIECVWYTHQYDFLKYPNSGALSQSNDIHTCHSVACNTHRSCIASFPAPPTHPAPLVAGQEVLRESRMETFSGESISAFRIAAIIESQNLSTSTVCGAAFTSIGARRDNLQSGCQPVCFPVHHAEGKRKRRGQPGRAAP